MFANTVGKMNERKAPKRGQSFHHGLNFVLKKDMMKIKCNNPNILVHQGIVDNSPTKIANKMTHGANSPLLLKEAPMIGMNSPGKRSGPDLMINIK